MGGDYTIRRACQSDREVMVAMFQSMLRETSPFGMEIMATADNAGRYFDSLIFPAMLAGDPILIAETPSGAVGMVCMLVNRPTFQTNRPSAAEHAIFVVPEWRRRGVASALRCEALAELRYSGVGLAQTYVYSGNTAAKKALRKMGARVAGTVWNFPLN